MNTPALPLDLRLVAWVFLYVGMDALAHDLIVLLRTHHISYGDPAPLCILVFFGLLRRNEGFRVLALILIAMGFCAALVVGIFVLTHHQGGTFMFFGHRLFTIPGRVMPFYFCATLLLIGWETMVLMRPGVAAMFRWRPPTEHSLANALVA